MVGKFTKLGLRSIKPAHPHTPNLDASEFTKLLDHSGWLQYFGPA